MITLDDRDVVARVDRQALVGEIVQCLIDLGTGAATQGAKQRLAMPHGDGFFLGLTGVVPRLNLAIAKWVSYLPVRPGVPGTSTSNILVSNSHSGELLGLVQGMAATELRTAAAAAAIAGSIDAEPRSIALLGYGRINRAVAECLLECFPSLDSISIVVRTSESAARALEQLAGLPRATRVRCEVTTDVDTGLRAGQFVFSATGAEHQIASLSMLDSDATLIALDGLVSWGADEASEPASVVLSDHDAGEGGIPSLAAALAANHSLVVTDARVVDYLGSAVADVALCSQLFAGTVAQ